MTKINVPLPSTPMLIVGRQPGTFTVAREWQRFFTLLLEAVGGSTNVITDVSVIEAVGSDSGDVEQAAKEAMEAWSYASANAGDIDALRNRFDGLDPQISGPQDFAAMQMLMDRLEVYGIVPGGFGAFVPDVPFAQPPIETGALEAAANIGYRIVAAGNADLVAGTVTINTRYAVATNEYTLTAKVVGGVQGFLSVGTVTANTSFVINSSNVADVSTVSWSILQPIKG